MAGQCLQASVLEETYRMENTCKCVHVRVCVCVRRLGQAVILSLDSSPWWCRRLRAVST